MAPVTKPSGTSSASAGAATNPPGSPNSAKPRCPHPSNIASPSSLAARAKNSQPGGSVGHRSSIQNLSNIHPSVGHPQRNEAASRAENRPFGCEPSRLACSRSPSLTESRCGSPVRPCVFLVETAYPTLLEGLPGGGAARSYGLTGWCQRNSGKLARHWRFWYFARSTSCPCFGPVLPCG